MISAGALALGGGFGMAGAYFTSQATVTNQSVATATVEIGAATKATSQRITATNFLPGDSTATTLTLSNTGSESVYYGVSLPREAGGDDVLADALQVTVAVAGGPSATQTLAAWQDGYLQSAVALAAGDAVDVTITVTLPGTVDDVLQGKNAAFTAQFDAIQVRNTPVPTAGWATR
ncbi:hypothetical protein FVA74_11765 [Salinibacterium sp. dk2585]|uniref:hypothetical protein n=1 Tax=unclassified Salinibacterium TaxID=2632331 RepID=UPI0011C24D8D|nr:MULTISPECIES: hypothetical protein [unclassified Salinibacterium]QEE62174.1 hypothetical protein FVA74_11765 [Salinibacterium sp. dk2585]TXK53526.1 hypothetical protein FVP63_10035 [Salinibacterium sp. dk5596]